ncbi:MAG: XRE family transcriptional regulator [Alcaligenaceae bacterium]|nr:MAG: XRE family transcriptional regulator [Alcaligenaceae bacterium]
MAYQHNRASPLPTVRPLKLPDSVRHSEISLPKQQVRSDCASRIGQQVRSLRLAAGASGGELARSSGVSRSMLSRIEHGLVSPSVETLNRIAEGLGVPMSRFFSDQTSRTDLSFVPAGSGLRVERVGAVAGYRYELLGHQLSGNLFVEPYLVTLLPSAQPYVTFQHPGVKFLHMLTGCVSYRYGDKVIKLTPGDSLQFDATALHGIEVIQNRPVSYLSVVSLIRH